ncbi:hypothetical protein [Cupriavidus necator]|uniref:hypothetical protein n=1 Tax=Cupriavidus necator TaxID=106590 RepID=UPI003F736BDA
MNRLAAFASRSRTVSVSSAAIPDLLGQPQLEFVRLSGHEYVGGEQVVQVVTSGMGPSIVQYDTSHYELGASRQDGGGDGTVPISSGRAPATAGNVRQWFALKGFAHEPAYKNETAQFVTLYSIVKLVSLARDPQGT